MKDCQRVKRVVTRKQHRPHEHVFLVWVWPKVELLQDCTLICKVHHVRRSVFGAGCEESVVPRDVHRLDGVLGDLHLVLFFAAFEVGRDGEDSYCFVVPSRGQQVAIKVEGNLIQARVLLTEVSLEFESRR